MTIHCITVTLLFFDSCCYTLIPSVLLYKSLRRVGECLSKNRSNNRSIYITFVRRISAIVVLIVIRAVSKNRLVMIPSFCSSHLSFWQMYFFFFTSIRFLHPFFLPKVFSPLLFVLASILPRFLQHCFLAKAFEPDPFSQKLLKGSLLRKNFLHQIFCQDIKPLFSLSPIYFFLKFFCPAP